MKSPTDVPSGRRPSGSIVGDTSTGSPARPAARTMPTVSGRLVMVSGSSTSTPGARQHLDLRRVVVVGRVDRDGAGHGVAVAAWSNVAGDDDGRGARRIVSSTPLPFDERPRAFDRVPVHGREVAPSPSRAR